MLPLGVYLAQTNQDIRNRAQESSFETVNVILFVDSQFYIPLESEIIRLSQDIENDLGLSVKVNQVDITTITPLEIRNSIKLAYENQGLEGIILIGDIPAVDVRNTNEPSDAFYSDLTDIHWKDEDNNNVYDTYWDDNDDEINDWMLNDQSEEKLKEIWAGRLQPPKNTISFNERVELMRSYFNRNHKYRTGEKTYTRSMIYADSISHSDRKEPYEDVYSRAETYFNSSWLYDNQEGDELHFIWGDTSEDFKNNLVQKLKEPYEYALINVHGTPTSQSFGDNTYLFANEFIEINSKIAFIDLRSCSNGNFKYSNYFAGWLLFSGDSLAVLANTVNTFYIGYPQANADIRLLDNGLIFGDIQKATNLLWGSTFFGDPTLRLRNPTTIQGNITSIFESIYSRDLTINNPRPYGRGIYSYYKHSLPCIFFSLLFNICFDYFIVYPNSRYKVSF